MNPLRPLAASFVLIGCSMAVSCVQAQAVKQSDASSLIELVRQYGRSTQPGKGAQIQEPVEKPQAFPINTETEGEYRSRMATYLVDKNFDQLEKAAHEARASKSRFPGGIWKLYIFYEGVTNPIAGDQASDSDWGVHFATLKAWASAKPDSATARVALAETYFNYAEKARGSGYANTVSDTGWKLYAERNALAASTLAEAAQLKEKCPYWYEVMQHVALGQGWEKSQARELFEQAAAFEPRFYHFYREYANYLLPKWNGEEGEAGAFAEEISNRIGGSEGKFVYFEIASLVRCQCDGDDSRADNLYWPKIKEGYAALGQLYGYSNLKTNRFAHMAVAAGDQEAAQHAFAVIGDDWDHSVWHSSQNFENAKLWADRQ
jgi:hypothetical protein